MGDKNPAIVIRHRRDTGASVEVVPDGLLLRSRAGDVLLRFSEYPTLGSLSSEIAPLCGAITGNETLPSCPGFFDVSPDWDAFLRSGLCSDETKNLSQEDIVVLRN